MNIPPCRDYRLQFGSPCVDVGNPATPDGATDVRGVPRDSDGDLDTVKLPDVGAFELATLYLQGQVSIGESMNIRVWGAAGGSADIYFSRRPLVDPPRILAFGELELDSSNIGFLRNLPTAPTFANFFTVMIPDDPSYVGLTFALQALTTSGQAWPPFAFSNAYEL